MCSMAAKENRFILIFFKGLVTHSDYHACNAVCDESVFENHYEILWQYNQ
jgi:hypothetical protein